MAIEFKYKKLIVALGMGITGYTVLAGSFTQLPQLSQFIPFLTTPIVGTPISVLTIAGALTLIGVTYLYDKF